MIRLFFHSPLYHYMAHDLHVGTITSFHQGFPNFALRRNRSPPFRSQQMCSCSNLVQIHDWLFLLQHQHLSPSLHDVGSHLRRCTRIRLLGPCCKIGRTAITTITCPQFLASFALPDQNWTFQATRTKLRREPPPGWFDYFFAPIPVHNVAIRRNRSPPFRS